MKTNLSNTLALALTKADGTKYMRFRLLLIFLASFFLLIFPLHLMADGYTVGQHFTYGGFEYEVLDPNTHTLSVFGCRNGSGTVTIPSSIQPTPDETWSVVKVEGVWQDPSWSDNITGVILPEGIHTLGTYCFNTSSKNSIETLVLPASLQTISETCFLHIGKKMRNVTVSGGSSYFEVGTDGALYTKGKTELVYVPSANGVTSFTIPEGVTKIRSEAFASHQTLETIKVSSTVTEFSLAGDGGTVPDVYNLKSISVKENNTYLYSVDGVLYDKVKKALVIYPRAKTGESFTIPDNITKINSYGFAQLRYLKSINLNNVETLEWRSIVNCSTLTSLTLPKGVTVLPSSSISLCWNISNYYVHPENTALMAYDGAVYSKDGKKLMYFPPAKTTYNFLKGVEVFSSGCLVSSKLTEVEIPKTVIDLNIESATALKTITFEPGSKLDSILIYTCPELTSITLPATVTKIKKGGFKYNDKLKTVTFPDGSRLKSIGKEAFILDPSLEEIVFEGSCTLESIEEKAFYDCPSLKEFTMPASVTYIGNLAFGNDASLKTVKFPNNAVITTIGQGAFSTSGIQYINLPPSLVTIEREAFRECKALHTVNVSKNAANISPEAFKLCENLTAINVVKANQTYSSWDGILLTKNKETLVTFPAGKGYSNFTLLPPSLKSIGEYAFYDCKQLTNVVIPNKVASIGQRAFGLCSNLNTVTFLCDDMIDPDNIVKGLNISSFDDDVLTNNPGDDTRGNITLNVRKELLNTYMSTPYYQKFNAINPSFVVEKENGNEEYIAVSDNKVDLLDTKNADHTYIIPRTVTNGNKTYTVAMVGDYAFQNNTSDVKEVVIFDNLEYIGAKAFMNDIENNTSTVENVFFIGKNPTENMLSTKRFDLDDTGNNYNEFAASTNIYVKKSVIDTNDDNKPDYKREWAKKVYNSTTGADDTVSPYDYTSRISYKIPGINITNRYGTFTREFDVDLAACPDEVGNGHVYAFVTPTDGIQPGAGDYGETEYHVQMHSINEDGEGDGTYIPAGTGVLLCAYDSNKAVSGDDTDADYFFYTIGEKDINVATTSVMQPITVNPKPVTDSNRDIYVMAANGVYKPLNGKTVTIPIHKSYLQIPGSAGAKVVFSLVMPDGEVTTIDNVRLFDEDTVAGSTVYDLQGRRLSTGHGLKKGIYIVNGKKVIMK